MVKTADLMDARTLLYWKPYSKVLPALSLFTPPTLNITPNIGRVEMGPIEIPYRCTISHVVMKWGATAAGNVYGAIYRDNGNTPAGGARVGVTASTARSGTNRLQLVPLAVAVRLNPGLYWVGMESSEVTSQNWYWYGTYLGGAIDPTICRAYYDLGPYGIPSDPCPAVTIDKYPRWMALAVQSIP